MTCEEFRLLLVRDPADCTAAERVSFFLHQKDCEPCRAVFNNRFKTALNKCKNPDPLLREAKDYAAVQVRKDAQDPEVQEQLKKHGDSQNDS